MSNWVRGQKEASTEGKLSNKDGRVLAHGSTTCLIFGIP